MRRKTDASELFVFRISLYLFFIGVRFLIDELGQKLFLLLVLNPSNTVLFVRQLDRSILSSEPFHLDYNLVFQHCVKRNINI